MLFHSFFIPQNSDLGNSSSPIALNSSDFVRDLTSNDLRKLDGILAQISDQRVAATKAEWNLYNSIFFCMTVTTTIGEYELLFRAVFKWLSKVITWLRLLRLVIGLKDLRQFFNQWEAKPKPIAPCTRDFFRASGKLQIIARNCDWFMELFVPVVIGRSNCFGFGFSTVNWKPLYSGWKQHQKMKVMPLWIVLVPGIPVFLRSPSRWAPVFV